MEQNLQKFLVAAGVLLFISAIILIFANFETLNIERKDKIVQIRIEKLPKICFGAKVRYFVTYSYQGEMFDKATRGDFCKRHYVGESIDMKYLEGTNKILRPDESVVLNLASFAIPGLMGIGISIAQWQKLRSFK